LLHSSSR